MDVDGNRIANHVFDFMKAIAGRMPKITTIPSIGTATPLEILSVAIRIMTRVWSNAAKPVANKSVNRVEFGLLVIFAHLSLAVRRPGTKLREHDARIACCG